MRSTILSQDPLPSLNRVYQMFLQEERLISAAKINSEQADIRAMAVKLDVDSSSMSRGDNGKHGDSGYKSTSSFFCSYCQRRGHEEAHCWTKHGFPEGWTNRPSRGGARGFGRGGRGSSRNAHPSNDRRGRNDVRASVVVVSHGETSASNPSGSNSFPNMTNEQW